MRSHCRAGPGGVGLLQMSSGLRDFYEDFDTALLHKSGHGPLRPHGRARLPASFAIWNAGSTGRLRAARPDHSQKRARTLRLFDPRALRILSPNHCCVAPKVVTQDTQCAHIVARGRAAEVCCKCRQVCETFTKISTRRFFIRAGMAHFSLLFSCVHRIWWRHRFGFFIRELYKYLSQGSIPRRTGEKPITPKDDAFFYWCIVVVGAFGTFVMTYGTFLMISELLRL
jgi:hypothetical protein